MQPIISIIVPCYNQAEYLPETLDCLLKQSIQNWECIIVNDGSLDASLAIANEYAEKDHRFIVVDKANGGLADARNAGILASHGKYILPLDSDDKIAPTYTQKATEYLENHSNVKLVYCKAKYFDEKNGEWELEEYDYEKLLWNNMIFCSCVYRKSDYDKTFGYNPNMRYGHEDWDYLLSLLDRNDKVYQIPEILFYYRKHGMSMITKTQEKQALCNLRMLMNHPDLYSQYEEKVIDWINPMTNYYHSELEKLYASKTYHVGQCVLFPLRLLKKLFQIGNKRSFKSIK